MNFLYEYFSIPKCLGAADRHQRLCRQTPGGDKYGQTILPSYDDLEAKQKLAEVAEKNKRAGHDLVKLCDSLLDSLLIKLNHECGDYDKSNPGSFTKTTLFPGGNYGTIINMNMYKEPAKALEIAEKLGSFGATHALASFVPEIKKAVTASDKAIADEKTAVNAEGIAKANAEVAKLQLIRIYNGNYHKAADESGKDFAEHLFPDLGGTSGNDKPDDNSDTTK